MNKAIFLDKDGVLVDNTGYPQVIPSDKLLHTNILSGLSFLNKRNYLLIIISNQSWIEKKQLTTEQAHYFFNSIINQLKKFEVEITDYYFCPHSAKSNCDCRKPGQRLIQEAVTKHNIDVSQSYFVGDMFTDVLAGKIAGLKTVLVRTGCGKEYSGNILPDYVIEDLNKINEVIER